MNKVVWPSGPRRWFKAPVFHKAWVRIPSLPDFEGGTYQLVHLCRNFVPGNTLHKISLVVVEAIQGRVCKLGSALVHTRSKIVCYSVYQYIGMYFEESVYRVGVQSFLYVLLVSITIQTSND